MYRIKGKGSKLKIFLLILSLILVGSIFVSTYVIEDSKVFTNIKEIAQKIVDTTTTGASYSITVSGTTTNYDTLAEAIEAASNGNTIVVLKDVTDTSTVNVNKTITLDTNGHTINRKSYIDVTPEGTLEIKGNGKITMAKDYVILNNGKVTLKEATLKSTSDASSGMARGIYNNGKLIIESGTIEAEGYDVYGILNCANAELIVTGGNIKVSSKENTAYGIYNNEGKLTIGDETQEISTKNPYIYGTTLAVESIKKAFNYYNGSLSSNGEKIYSGDINTDDETIIVQTNSGVILKQGIACESY